MKNENKNTVRIHNTKTRRKVDFEPVHPSEVRMYICGPTVYDYIHIGNARPLIFFDVVRRYFEYIGYSVTFVQNITDIDDKIIKKSLSEKKSAEEVAEKYTNAFFEDCSMLGVRVPDHRPKATGYIDQMIGLIANLVGKGFAYNTDGNVFFEVSKFNEYGNFSGKDLDQMEIGERVEEEIRSQKRDPVRDFALWKKAKPGEPSWDSPWGKGRPGWHTECVVMSTDLLGGEFDIHGGGVDLVFPHHENEIAQADCGIGGGFARYWMHNEFVTIRGEKMAKSLGNQVTVKDMVQRFSKEAIRLFFLQTHYRKQLSFDFELLSGAESAVERISRIVQRVDFTLKNNTSLVNRIEDTEESKTISDYRRKIKEAMNDDFNTAKAIGEVFSLIGELEKAEENAHDGSSEAFELLLHGRKLLNEFDAVFEIIPEESEIDENEIELLIEQRKEFRRNKDWSGADKIRDRLLEMGIIIEDTKDGTRWHKKR